MTHISYRCRIPVIWYIVSLLALVGTAWVGAASLILMWINP